MTDKKSFPFSGFITKFPLMMLGLLLAVFMFSKVSAYADDDEILNYEITVDVLPDATLDITYHIDWMVLDSDSAGALTWVKIGIPNRHHTDPVSYSDVVDYMTTDSRYVNVYFKDKYYEGDVVSFDFTINQDYLYQVNRFTEGRTVYTFTPGWFDDIRVDNLTVRWTYDQAESWSESGYIDGDYIVWNTSLAKGEKVTYDIEYDNYALGFDLTKTDEVKYGGSSLGSGITAIFAIILFLMFTSPFLLIVILTTVAYRKKAVFGDEYNKITRTKIEYYPSCQGCGAVRADGEKNCSYCGRSFIKSEVVLSNDELKKGEKAATKFRENGEYAYNSPNTFIHVNVVRTPRPVVSSSSHHSSCAHSSCACACACACAGGGRAGCTTKDFYNTNLKLSRLKKAVDKKL